MSLMKLAFGLVSVLPVVLPSTVGAADLYGDPPSRYYSEDYYAPRPSREVYVERYERRDYPPPVPAYGSYKDGPAIYDPVPPPRYSQSGCVPRELIRDRLVGEGWRDFSSPELRDGLAVLKARRPSGEPYILKLDRCTGAIVDAHPLHRGPYAWGPRRHFGPRYWD